MKLYTLPMKMVPQIDFDVLLADLDKGPIFVAHKDYNAYKVIVMKLRHLRPNQSLSMQTVYSWDSETNTKRKDALCLTLNAWPPTKYKSSRHAPKEES